MSPIAGLEPKFCRDCRYIRHTPFGKYPGCAAIVPHDVVMGAPVPCKDVRELGGPCGPDASLFVARVPAGTPDSMLPRKARGPGFWTQVVRWFFLPFR